MWDNWKLLVNNFHPGLGWAPLCVNLGHFCPRLKTTLSRNLDNLSACIGLKYLQSSVHGIIEVFIQFSDF